jgi:large subunit ribosomal protein L15
MKLNELRHRPGAKTKKMCVGRGIGCGKGKTSGRGVKGQKARTGVQGVKGQFEGGQTPLFRRLPKLGFSNRAFAARLVEVSLAQIQDAIDCKKIDIKKTVDEDALVAAGVVSSKKDGIKLLGNGSIKSKIELKITKATKPALAAVEKAGGKVDLIVIVRKAVPRNRKIAK